MTLANRNMIYAETLGSFISVSTGISVWFSHGTLWHALKARAETEHYSAYLGAPMITLGVLLTAVCLLEQTHGRSWDEETLLKVTVVRKWLCVIQCLVHCSLLVAMLQLAAFWIAPAVTMNCVILISFFALAAYKSARLKVALDPEKPTEKLRREIPISW